MIHKPKDYRYFFYFLKTFFFSGNPDPSQNFFCAGSGFLGIARLNLFKKLGMIWKGIARLNLFKKLGMIWKRSK